MKRLFTYFSFLILLISIRPLKAQSSKNNTGNWRYTASFELMTPPISSLIQTNNTGYGLNLKTEYYLNKNVATALLAGFDYFPGSRYSYYPDDPNTPGYGKIYKRGVPFRIIPLMAGIHYYPAKWFYLSGSAGLTMGGSKGGFKVTVGYEPEMGFLIPVKRSYLNIGLRFLYTNLRVEDAYSGMGGVINGSDFAQAMGISLGWKF